MILFNVQLQRMTSMGTHVCSAIKEEKRGGFEISAGRATNKRVQNVRERRVGATASSPRI